MNKEGIKLRGTAGLVSIVAAINMGAGVSNASVLHTLSAGKRAIIRKVMWSNRTAGNTMLRIGYNSLAVTFVQCLPDIEMVAGFDGELNVMDIPICGNNPLGFCPDTTPLTGTTGTIMGGAVASAAAPNDVQVTIEVEEF